MKTKLAFALLLLPVFAAISHSQSISGLYSVSYEKLGKLPYVGGESARFAYVSKTGTIESVCLAEMTEAVPEPKAEDLKTLARFETDAAKSGISERILDMSASPDNRYLLVYALQDGRSFIDHNIYVYDMREGQYLGSINEHSFHVVNNGGVFSQLLYDYLIESELTHEEAIEVDPWLQLEGILDTYPKWQWNEEGSLTVFMTFYVHRTSDGAPTEFVGEEEYSITYEIASDRLIREGVNVSKSKAADSSIFRLGIDSAAGSEMTFLNRHILFPDTRIFGRRKGKSDSVSKGAEMIEGNIPVKYRWY